MSPPAMPEGTYFSVIGNIRLGAGGQTRLALLRHRLLAQHAGLNVPILTYNPVPTYAPIRADLLANRMLLPDSSLLNMHEDLRIRDLSRHPVKHGQVRVARVGAQEFDLDPGGTPWRLRHVDSAGTDVRWDYLRPDGSVYASTPADDGKGTVDVVNEDGGVIESWPSLGGLWRWWTEQMAGAANRVFLLSDSRFIAEELSLLTDDRFYVFHQIHANHLGAGERWNSPVSATYRSSLENLGRLDGLVSLTGRQRQDIAVRYGPTTNLFVIPNPVEALPPPDVLSERDDCTIVMIARLEPEKQIDVAIKAFTIVLEQVPQARLDIYGDGKLRESLQQLIDANGLQDAVTLHGFDPRALDVLWNASVFWLTSRNEGYPLSTLEAMSHGCPVVAFDIRYGPREQINEGVDGYLVDSGDLHQLAARTVEICQSPEKLAHMGRSALTQAAAHGHQRFLNDWQRVLDEAIVLKQRRTTLENVRLVRHRLEVPSSGRWLHRHNKSGDVRFAADLVVVGTSADSTLAEAVVALEAYSPDHEGVLALPLDVQRTGNSFRISSEFDVFELELPASAKRVMFRLQFVWQNSAWQRQLIPGGLNVEKLRHR